MTISSVTLQKSIRSQHTLSLAGKNLNDYDISAICGFLSSHPEITTLDVSDNLITHQGAKDLADVESLTTLNLTRNNIGAEGAKALAANKYLKTLNISQNNLNADAVLDFETNTHLLSLDVSDNNIEEERAALALAANTTLKSLNLGGNKLWSDKGWSALLASNHLQFLDMSRIETSFERNKHDFAMTTIPSLNLSENYHAFGFQVMERISRNKNITSLSLKGRKLDAVDLGYLEKMENLAFLDLSSNYTSGYVHDLGHIADMKALKSICMSQNGLSDKDVKSITANKNLTHIDVSHNEICDEGARDFALCENLISLDLRKNSVGDKGAKSLAASKSLKSLDVRSTNITLEGASALIRSNIPNLRLSGDFAKGLTSVELAKFLLSIPTNRKLLDLHISSSTDATSMAIEDNIAHLIWSLPSNLQAQLNNNVDAEKLAAHPAMRKVTYMSAFEKELNHIALKKKELHSRNDKKAFAEADKLFNTLDSLKTQYKNFEIDDTQFKKFAKDAIDFARPELAKHRGWKEIFYNLGLCILGLGVFYLATCAYRGSFFKLKTDSTQKLDQLQIVIDSPIKPSTSVA